MTELSVEDQIAEQNKLLEKEFDRWNDLGVVPEQVVEVNTLLTDIFVHSLASFFVEKGIVDDAEMTLFFKKRLLERLQKIREDTTPMIQQQRRAQLGIETVMALPTDIRKIH